VFQNRISCTNLVYKAWICNQVIQLPTDADTCSNKKRCVEVTEKNRSYRRLVFNCRKRSNLTENSDEPVMSKLKLRTKTLLLYFFFCQSLISGYSWPGLKGVAKSRSKRSSIRNPTCLTAAEKKVALDAHNKARTIVVPSATNMMKMVWDEELAKNSEVYSRKCRFAHSFGLRTSKFGSVGENLWMRGGSSTTPSRAMNQSVIDWDDEKRMYDLYTNRCSGVCGHYTQVVWAQSYAVGCGATLCNNVPVPGGSVWDIAILVVCQYGPPGNVVGLKPYEQGGNCTNCPADASNHCIKKLCANSTSDPPPQATTCSGASSLHSFTRAGFLTLLLLVVLSRFVTLAALFYIF